MSPFSITDRHAAAPTIQSPTSNVSNSRASILRPIDGAIPPSATTFDVILAGYAGENRRRNWEPALWDAFLEGLPIANVVLCDPGRTLDDDELMAGISERARGVVEPQTSGAFLAKLRRQRLETVPPSPEGVKRIAIVSVPQREVKGVLRTLARIHREGDVVLLEKPHGRDLASFRELMAEIDSLALSVHLVDHFRAKSGLLSLFEHRPLLDRVLLGGTNVQSIAVRALERRTVAGRAAFYDAVGALKDMFSHTLAVVEPVLAAAVDGSTDAAMARLAPFDPARVTLGQYEGYRGEPGVAHGSSTETFVRLETEAELPSRGAAPVTITTGKALAEELTEVVVELRGRNVDIAAPAGWRPIRLTARVQPDPRITVSGVASNGTALSLVLASAAAGRAPHEVLLAAAAQSDAGAFVGREAAEHAWSLIEAVQTQRGRPVVYQKFSQGPSRPSRRASA